MDTATRNTVEYIADVVMMLGLALGKGLPVAVHVTWEGDRAGLLNVGREDTLREDRRIRELGLARSQCLLNETEVREMVEKGKGAQEIVERALGYIPADLR